ncbi:PREDICTED: cornulin [Charadrius vociferus]|uniref:cornulin n=1 Tax=Charadrius vociferus TaxID=50402 RepID=UPI000521A1AF|nr:PREDICTED: cornulin [Charadrius vociferus]
MAQPQENASDIGAVFYVCARSDGDCSPLRREELRQLMEQEFADAMENPQDPKTVKKLLRFLDDDSNHRLDFSELLSLVFRTAKACYKPLQQGLAPEDGQEPREQEEAGGEQPPGPRTVGRVSCNQQDPEQGVNSQDQDTETQDPDNPQTQEGETQEKDQDNRQTQEGETQEKDQDNRQTQEGETPEQDQDNHQTQEGKTQEKDQDNRQTQEGETPKQDQDNRQTREGETPKQDQDNHQTQEGETPEQNEDDRQTQEGEAKEQDQDEDGRAEEPEGNPERGEILGTVTPGQARNTHKAEETEALTQDPKTRQAKETEAQGQGSNHHQSPEKESAEQDLNCLSETRGRDPNNKTQDCKAPQQGPNPGKTQKLLPLQRGASPHRDPKPQGTHRDTDFHRLPESKVLEQEHNGAEAPSCPAQQPQDVHQHIQPPIEQQVLQSLYQWPPQQ